MRAIATLALALAVMTTAGLAAADDPEAEQALDRGVEARRQGNDAEALSEFKRAFAIAPTAHARAQIGLAESALRRWVDAERDLRAALAAPDAWVEKNRVPIERALAGISQNLATVVVTADDPRAEVWINGEKRGSAGEHRVVNGTVLIEVRAPGKRPVEQSVTLLPEARLAVKVELRTLDTAPAVVRPVVVLPPGAAAPLPENGRRTWGFVALGGAAISLGLGAAALALALDRRATYAACGRDAPRSVECDGDLGAFETWRAVSIGGFALGTASAILGVWLLSTSRAKQSVACAPLFPGLACSGAL